ncbi:hypothetical protein Gasu2_34130 [Galdieria sulphuraria]|uniref:Uncharacterized protein n=1 Tax=Galdieria sulphuraria TaxID=130081 RepID=M2XR37_GALSU|nr:uncharacterized protein Gasu_62240 [Galdieria sulphuraria]EME26128.1 hypothetical protein Gasu_62240 [Galdieria sulphuraria]GJD09143.1 hypothetical protein Gasu2_34130 [Galdieria sulphuraria]|eukprot:XP_005702648.1 hypothetical protein Gasu_62240 [Galdieria sulphuraria]
MDERMKIENLLSPLYYSSVIHLDKDTLYGVRFLFRDADFFVTKFENCIVRVYPSGLTQITVSALNEREAVTNMEKCKEWLKERKLTQVYPIQRYWLRSHRMNSTNLFPRLESKN